MMEPKVIGIETDSHCLRGVRSRQIFLPRLAATLEDYAEVKGDFTRESLVVKGLQTLLHSLDANPEDTVISCLSGGETHIAEQFLDRVPQEPDAYAREHMGDLFPFDLRDARMDCQVFPGPEGDKIRILAAAVSTAKLNSHLRAFEQLGVRVSIVDLLPLAIANARFAAGEEEGEGPALLLHIGSRSCTLVIDGPHSFFYRTIPFPFQSLEETLSQNNRWVISIPMICEELIRTLAYYERRRVSTTVETCYLMGNCQQSDNILEAIPDKVGLRAAILRTASGFSGDLEMPEGKFELSAALSLRDRRVHLREEPINL